MAVDDADVALAFPRALLRGREFVVPHDAVSLQFLGPRGELDGFATADEVACRVFACIHQLAADDLDAERAHELSQLIEQGFRAMRAA